MAVSRARSRRRCSTNIAAQHPTAIAFDIQFTDPSSLGQKDDIAFLTAISNTSKPRCSPSRKRRRKGRRPVLRPGPDAVGPAPGRRRAGERPCSRSSRAASIREMSYSIDKLTTFADRHRAGRDRQQGQPFTGTKWIDFLGPAGTYQSISFGNVYGTRRTKIGPKNFFKGQDRRDRRRPRRRSRTSTRRRRIRQMPGRRGPGQRDRHRAATGSRCPSVARLGQRAC